MSTRSRIAISMITAAILSVIATSSHAADVKDHPEKFIKADGSTNKSADIMKTKHDTVKNSISNAR
jgi:hypothetical protein